MRVYISADMEGVAGIVNLEQTVRGGSGYAAAQHLLTDEVNAAVAGAFDGGATSVVVNDSHGTMDNLLPAELDPRVQVVLGSPKALCMAHGLDTEFDVAFFLGYHAAAGSSGVLAHSFSSHFYLLRLNGQRVSEADVNALHAAECGVPVGLITGDAIICADAAEKFPGIVTVAVKSAAGWAATRSVHPTVAHERIRLGAEQAVRNPPPVPQLSVPDRLVAEIDMAMPSATDLVAQVPGAERLSELTVRHSVASVSELLGLITIWSQLAGVSARERLGLVQRR